MVKIFHENSFEGDFQSKKPWKNIIVQRKHSSEHFAAPRTVMREEKGVFTSPIGVNVASVRYKRVDSVFREVFSRTLDARILEYHQFEKLPYSILIVLPNDNIVGLQKISNEMLKEKLPIILEGLTPKRVTAVLPSDVHRELEKAQVESITDPVSRTPMNYSIVAQDFNVDGPFMVVMYDQAKSCPVGISRVYDSSKVTDQMLRLIKEYQKRDDKLIREASLMPRTSYSSSAASSITKEVPHSRSVSSVSLREVPRAYPSADETRVNKSVNEQTSRTPSVRSSVGSVSDVDERPHPRKISLPNEFMNKLNKLNETIGSQASTSTLSERRRPARIPIAAELSPDLQEELRKCASSTLQTLHRTQPTVKVVTREPANAGASPSPPAPPTPVSIMSKSPAPSGLLPPPPPPLPPTPIYNTRPALQLARANQVTAMPSEVDEVKQRVKPASMKQGVALPGAEDLDQIMKIAQQMRARRMVMQEMPAQQAI